MKNDNLFNSQLQFVYQDQIARQPMIGGKTTYEVVFRRNQTSSTMVVNVFRNESKNTLSIRWAYRTYLFSKETIEQMHTIYKKSLTELMK